jgi:hypothetical protein
MVMPVWGGFVGDVGPGGVVDTRVELEEGVLDVLDVLEVLDVLDVLEVLDVGGVGRGVEVVELLEGVGGGVEGCGIGLPSHHP